MNNLKLSNHTYQEIISRVDEDKNQLHQSSYFEDEHLVTIQGTVVLLQCSIDLFLSFYYPEQSLLSTGTCIYIYIYICDKIGIVKVDQ